jgi:hypothetical protein
MEYNYAKEIVDDDDAFHYETAYVRRYDDPKEQIVNEQDQDITVNTEAEKNAADEALVAFEEGLKNDNISTEEKKNNDKLPPVKNR